jgi:hypothetical protein
LGCLRFQRNHVSNITKFAHGFGLLGAVILAVLVIGAIIYAMQRERIGDP